MTKRRGRGDGSIYKRKSDGLWVGMVELGWEVGKRRRKPVYGKTKTEVAKKLRKLQSTVDKSLPTPDERINTEKYLQWWMAEVLPTRDVKESTADGYRYILGRYVIPHVGRVRLAKLGPEHVHAMLRTLENWGFRHVLAVRLERYSGARFVMQNVGAGSRVTPLDSLKVPA